MATPTKVMKDGKVVKDRLGRTQWKIVYRIDGKWTSGRMFAHRLQDAYAEIDKREIGSSPHSGGLTWSEGLSLWLEAQKDLSPYTLAGMEKSVTLLSKFVGDKPVCDTSSDDIMHWLEQRSKEVSQSTVKRDRAVLTMGRWLKHHQKVQLPWHDEDFPKFKKAKTLRERRAIPTEQLPQYIRAVMQVAYPPSEAKQYVGHPGKFQDAGQHIIRYLLLSGVRSTEACLLTEQSYADRTLSFIQKGRRDRSLIVPGDLEECLRAAIEYKRACQINHDFIFFNTKGEPWNRGSLIHFWRRRLKCAKLPYFTIHELRHTFCSAAGSLNFKEGMIQAASGHESAESLRKYTHPTNLMQEEVTTAVGNLFAPKLYPDKE